MEIWTDNNHKIVWLASYPKSGNTWFRAFLANLLNNSETPASINDLEGGPIASSRPLFDEATGLSSADLTSEEIENLRPEVYSYMAAESNDILFHKIHDAYTFTPSGAPLIPADSTRCVLYFIRNPLDLAVSFSHHANLPCEVIVENMNNNDYAFCSRPDKLHNQLTQKLLTWSNHIQSWVDNSNMPVLVTRFEDMKNKPFQTFARAIEFTGLEFSREQIEKAIEFSDFEVLAKQESQNGFKEKSQNSDKFFRKGQIGTWREELSPRLVNHIVNQHQEMMIRFGYLTRTGKLLV